MSGVLFAFIIDWFVKYKKIWAWKTCTLRLYFWRLSERRQELGKYKIKKKIKQINNDNLYGL